LVEAVTETEYSAELLTALTQAASACRPAAWLAELLRQAMAMGAEESSLIDLINAAPASARGRLLEQALESSSAATFPLGLLSSIQIEWSAETTRRALDLLGQRVRAETQQYTFPRTTLLDWGRRAHIDTAVAAMERIDSSCPDPSPWRNAVEALKETIGFRAAMRQELLT
jgi:hypothetical protein